MDHLDDSPAAPPSPVRVGGLTRDKRIRTLGDHGVELNAHASTLLEHPMFERREPESVHVVTVTLDQIGLPDGGTLPEVFEAAGERGLELCPPDTAPYFRLAWMSQPNAPDSVLSAGRSPAGAVKVAAAPLRIEVEFPKGFYLRVVDHQRWLRGYRCDDEYAFTAEDRFVFRAAPKRHSRPMAELRHRRGQSPMSAI